MSQDVDQTRGPLPSPPLLLRSVGRALQELCTTSSDPFLFSFSRTKALKLDYFPLPIASNHHNNRKDKGRASLPTSLLSSSSSTTTSSSRFTRIPTPSYPHPPTPGRSSPLGSVPSASSATYTFQNEDDVDRRRSERRVSVLNDTQKDNKMASTIVATPGENHFDSPWFAISPFSTKSLQYIFSEEEGCGARKALFPQSRELYIHPSQIFSPSPAPTLTAAGAASIITDLTSSGKGPGSGSTAMTGNVNLNAEEGETSDGIQTALTLPPMLTVEEIEAEVFKQLPHTDVNAPAQASDSIPVPADYQPGYPPYMPYASMPGPPHDPRYWPAHPLSASYDQLQQVHYPPQYSTFLPPDLADDYPPVPSASAPISTPYYGQPGPSNYLAPLPHAYPAPGSGESRVYSDTSVAVHPTSTPPTAHSVNSVAASVHSLATSVAARSDSPIRPSTSGGKSEKSDNATSEESIEDGKRAKRTGKLPAATTVLLKEWLMAHVHHPYPTEDEKKELCAQTKLAMSQVSNWFINARRRILPALGTVVVSGNRKQVNTPMAPLPPSQRLNAIGARLPPTRTTAAAARAHAHPYSAYPHPAAYAAPPVAQYPPGYPGVMHPPLAPYPPYAPEHGYYPPPPSAGHPHLPSQGPAPPQ